MENKRRRKKMARLAELIRMLGEEDGNRKGREIEQALIKKTRRNDCGMTRRSLEIWARGEAKKVQKEQEEAENKAKIRGITNWRRNMLQGWDTMGRYIKSQSNKSPDVTNDKKKLSTRREVCMAMEEHAKTVVGKKHEEMENKRIDRGQQIGIVTKALQKGKGTQEEEKWRDPSVRDIWEKMKQQRGSGSPEGWHGEEIKDFPEGVAELFGEITKRWRKAGIAPDSVKYARQVNLVKETKITELNTIEAGDLRPISVISIWWRVITSCWVTGEDLKKWRNSIIPKEVVCDGTSTEACAAEVCEELDNKGYLGTLDFSLCYDHIDPKLIVEVKRMRFPKYMATLLEDVWTQLRRYVIYEGECSKKAYKAGNMIMQGDSFGPFALHILMAAGEIWTKEKMRKRKGGKYSLVYMDDRNLVTDDPNTLCKYVKAWQAWSGKMGLKENAQKTKIIAKTKKGRAKLRKAAEEHKMGEFVKMEAEVLGVVTWTGKRKMEKKEQDRVERAKKMAARIAVMPGARERKRMAYRSYGAPVQAYGWIAKGMPAGEEGKSTTAALRAVNGKAHKLGSRNLKKY